MSPLLKKAYYGLSVKQSCAGCNAFTKSRRNIRARELRAASSILSQLLGSELLRHDDDVGHSAPDVGMTF